MKKQTDLDKIKELSKGLLNINIIETDYSPMIVSHPFTKSGFVHILEDDNYTLLNIAENKTAFVKWKKQMEKQIDSSTDVFQIYLMLNDAYSLEFFARISNYLSEEEFSKLLANVWMNSEYANMDYNVNKRTMLSYFQKANSSHLMNEDELGVYNSLDDNITIYRGVTSYNKRNVKALSWTLDFNKAKWFATRYGEDGTIYSANIDKQYIYAYFDRKNESEIIVDPKYLLNISQTNFPHLEDCPPSK